MCKRLCDGVATTMRMAVASAAAALSASVTAVAAWFYCSICDGVMISKPI